MKNVTIFADRQIDRSPCGTGASARVATLYARGELIKGETFGNHYAQILLEHSDFYFYYLIDMAFMFELTT
ncbi:hypothetical protein GCM10011409_19890 [Lentibacillus populi]|uniref:Proline racemase n=1 Tax=Lentibacillus populi TaxID=1827502 RepID=A0A9W5TYD2_9BACI|nr:hypothetical protein GCM10011409_19890 [Lentibacillus populi]